MNFKRQQRSKRLHLPEVSLTPLIDTALTLLIIFMITTPMIQDSIRLSLPETKNAKAQAAQAQLSKEPTIIAISKDGKIYLNDKPIDVKNLKKSIKQKIDNSKDKAVTVKGDKEVLFDRIIQVVDEIQGIEGVTSVNLATKHIN